MNDKAITQAAVTEINRLHKENMEAAKQTLERAIRIGELLEQEKKKVMQGVWLDWLKANVEFSERTAQRYMWVFKNRAKLKSDTVTDLASAYQFLTEGAPEQNTIKAASAVLKGDKEAEAKEQVEAPAKAKEQEAQAPKAEAKSAPTTKDERCRKVTGQAYNWAEVNIFAFRAKFPKTEQAWVLSAIIDYCLRDMEEQGFNPFE